MNLYINQLQKKNDFRNAIYAGDIFLNTDLNAPKDLCAFARESITAAFDGETRHQALHTMMPVQEFIGLVTKLKGQFTNCIEVKEMIRNFVLEIGANPGEFLFDVPRIRVVPHYDYLHAGVSYAYKPHRDKWYGSVDCQINTWMPVYTIQPDQTMMINPAYFSVPVKNSSADWSLSDWINVQRPLAQKNVIEELRVHPIPLEDISTASEIRIAANAGEILTFSGSHLHGTVPNYTEQTRFSIDFRLVHIADLLSQRGAVNVDSGVADTEAGYKDFFHVSDFSHFQGTNQ
ncbi:hypothetical protein QN399_03335 [Pseudomonas sp. 10C3]|uniref:hypothetical protein n=1 Tax=unclassified Pseudomonas TaxID=196821 RepID=UPI002E81443D|nr:hypothetical protein [Pseudomonas sp. 10C3]MEE3505307.1 hypothetical protein [Pseudomonas sp. 10C3]